MGTSSHSLRTERLGEAAKQFAALLPLVARKLKPSRQTIIKATTATLVLGAFAAVGANYLPKLAGQSNITAVEAAQTAFAQTNGGIITDAEFDIGHEGSRYGFEILSGGKKYDVDVDAMSGKAHVYSGLNFEHDNAVLDEHIKDH